MRREPAASAPTSTPDDSRDDSPEETQDRDGDQIDDTRDRCPEQAERYNGFEDSDGCPDKSPLSWGGDTVFITFKERSAELAPEQGQFIDDTAHFLEINPNITLYEVGGHAEVSEERGPRKQLSQRRADAVKKALIEKGIDKKRLVSRGFGSDCPFTKDPETERDRAMNRRITLRILETTSGPYELEACPRWP